MSQGRKVSQAKFRTANQLVSRFRGWLIRHWRLKAVQGLLLLAGAGCWLPNC